MLNNISVTMVTGKNRKVYIYALIDPRDNEPKYIGKTVNLEKRLKAHLKSIELKKVNKKISWIKKLYSLGLIPSIKEIDCVDETNWEYWEKFYIHQYKEKGFGLKNGTDGGEGNNCWQLKHKKETKNKISKALLNKPKTEEHKKKLAIKKIGNKNASGQHNYCREKHHGFIQETIYVISQNNKTVVGIYDSVLDYCNINNLKSHSTTSQYHAICRSKGKKSRDGHWFVYKSDCLNTYNIGNVFTEFDLKEKNKKVIAINKRERKEFSSIKEASLYYKVSEGTIKNYIKSGNTLIGDKLSFLVKEEKPGLQIVIPNKIGFTDVLFTKKYLLSQDVKTLNTISDKLLNKLKNMPFPYRENKESLQDVLQNIRNNIKEDIKDNVFFNGVSSAGNNYLKSIFKNYYESSYKDKQSPVQMWEDEKTLKQIIDYRLGINKKRETFDFSLKMCLQGIAARRGTISFFKPVVAAQIYTYFLKGIDKPIVVDPCSGFGGRLLGFAAIFKEGTYIGIEPNVKTFQYLTQLKQELTNLYPNLKINLFNCKLEDYKGIKECDLTFTSIPYFDLESYEGNELNYSSKEEWIKSIKEGLLSYNNLLINLPMDLQSDLNLPVKEIYYLQNLTSHFDKKRNNKLELIVKGF